MLEKIELEKISTTSKVMFWEFSRIHIFISVLFQAQALKLTLDEYDQSESETKCTKGLLQGKDYAIFKGTFNWEGASQDYSRVVELALRANEHSNIDTVCVIQTAYTCRGHEGKYPCYCERVDEDRTFHLIFKITATTSISQAEVRLQVSHINQSQIFSETRRLPEIFESAKSMQINYIFPETEFCFLTLNASEDVISSCCRNLPQPCVSTISRNGLKVASSDGCSSHRLSDSSAWTSIYKFILSVCGDENYVQPVTCIVQHDTHLLQDKNQSLDNVHEISTTHILNGLILAILLTIVLIQTYIVYRMCSNKRRHAGREENAF